MNEPIDEEEVIIKATPETKGYSNHPKIKAILKNPDVKEIHIRFRRNMQLYVGIVFRNGSTIERPLIDILEDEQPLCSMPEEEEYDDKEEECSCGHNHAKRKEPAQIVPQKKSKWNFLSMKNKGQSTDIASIVENNENITVKRIVTIIKKDCGCENEHSHSSTRHGKRVPIEYEEVEE